MHLRRRRGQLRQRCRGNGAREAAEERVRQVTEVRSKNAAEVAIAQGVQNAKHAWEVEKAQLIKQHEVQVEALQARAREAERIAEEGSAAIEAAKQAQKEQAALENGVLQARDLCARREEEARQCKARA